jgi:hypothetical protein
MLLSLSKRRYVTDTQDAEVVKNETERRWAQRSESVLRGIKPNVRVCMFWKHCLWLLLWFRILLLLRQLRPINWRNLREASNSGAVPATPTPGLFVLPRIKVIFLNQNFPDPKMLACKARTFPISRSMKFFYWQNLRQQSTYHHDRAISTRPISLPFWTVIVWWYLCVL